MVIDCIPLPTLFRTVDYEKTHDPHAECTKRFVSGISVGFFELGLRFQYSFRGGYLVSSTVCCDLVSLYDSGLMIG
jgi:hypothetical protein